MHGGCHDATHHPPRPPCMQNRISKPLLTLLKKLISVKKRVENLERFFNKISKVSKVFEILFCMHPIEDWELSSEEICFSTQKLLIYLSTQKLLYGQHALQKQFLCDTKLLS